MLRRPFYKNAVVAFVEISPTPQQRNFIQGSFDRFQQNVQKRYKDLQNGGFQGLKVSIEDIPKWKLSQVLPWSAIHKDEEGLPVINPGDSLRSYYGNSSSDTLKLDIKRVGLSNLQPLDFKLREHLYNVQHSNSMHVTTLPLTAFESGKSIDKFFHLLQTQLPQIQKEIADVPKSVVMNKDFGFFTSTDLYRVFLGYTIPENINKQESSVINPLLDVLSQKLKGIISQIEETPLHNHDDQFLAAPHSTIADVVTPGQRNLSYVDLRFMSEIYLKSKEELSRTYSDGAIDLNKISEISPNYQQSEDPTIEYNSPRLIVVVNNNRLVFPLTSRG